VARLRAWRGSGRGVGVRYFHRPRTPARGRCVVFGTMVHWYQLLTGYRMPGSSKTFEVERIQTGVRMERRVLKVLKALAEYKNMTLGDLIEGMVLHAFEGKTAFTAETLRKIGELKGIYGLDLDARASHRLKEKP
jgi:hypothetical protein